MSSSVGKRQREQRKLEQTAAKAVRKAARREAGAAPSAAVTGRSEAELTGELGELRRALERGEVRPEEFELRRDEIQVQLERFL